MVCDEVKSVHNLRPNDYNPEPFDNVENRELVERLIVCDEIEGQDPST